MNCRLKSGTSLQQAATQTTEQALLALTILFSSCYSKITFVPSVLKTRKIHSSELNESSVLIIQPQLIVSCAAYTAKVFESENYA